MTTTLHTITVVAKWNDTPYALISLQGTNSTDDVSFHDVTLAKLGIHRPAPFVPPFKVGDIIVQWNKTRIVGDVNELGATLVYPSDRGVEGTLTWHALETHGWTKIGEVTP